MKSRLVSASALAVLVSSQLGCSSGATDASPAAAGAALEAVCALSSDERLRDMSDAGIGSTSALGLASGRYALPATSAPTQLVVMFHGSHNDSCSWRNHLRQAAEHGAVALAMDYTGQRIQADPGHPDIVNYGWFVNEGAADSIAAAKYFMAKYPSITQVFAFGVSMGGNASGMAVSSPDAVRADGSGLFDYWVDIEGVNNLIEEYAIIRAVAPGVHAAAVAQAEIEEEAGGPLEEQPEAYAALTNVARVKDMVTNGLKGAIVINGVDDGLVSTSQSPELGAALNAALIPTHVFTLLLRGDTEAGTTATGSFAFGPGAPAEPVYDATGQGDYESPFSGHGWEGSDTHLGMRTGLEQLWLLMAGGDVSPDETVVIDDTTATPN